LIHIGEKQFGGGRAGESAAYGITEDLIKEGFEAGRMKTGTPPRVDGRSLDYSKMNEEKVTRDLISFHTLMLLHRLFIKGLVT
jgi:tRNA uridine 5-carboxymethylaminomethyl modification enzyme